MDSHVYNASLHVLLVVSCRVCNGRTRTCIILHVTGTAGCDLYQLHDTVCV